MDDFTSLEIKDHVDKLLREVGAKDPPINLSDVLEHLKVHHSYYDLSNPSFLQEMAHRLKVGSYKVLDVVSRIDLRGLWLPDENKILISEEVPKIKQRWVTAHEVGHRIVPWHKDFIFGDTAETLNPDYQEQIEGEANFSASLLLFLSERFSAEARDYKASLKSVFDLSRIYGNTKTTTLRRFIDTFVGPAIVGVVSKPHWKPTNTGSDLCRYFVGSPFRHPEIR